MKKAPKIHYVLTATEVFLDMAGDSWVSYEIKGTNGNNISGWMRGTLTEVKSVLRKQLSAANRRRRPTQDWTSWTWSADQREKLENGPN